MNNPNTLTSMLQVQEVSEQLKILLQAVAESVKAISQAVASAGLKGQFSAANSKNVQGEEQQQLDVISDQIFCNIVSLSGQVALMVSEEREEVFIGDGANANSPYLVSCDPLDGSSNLGMNIPVGTIFAVWNRLDMQRPATAKDFLQTGRKAVAAGYASYGSSTLLTISWGRGVNTFTLDPVAGEFVLVASQQRISDRGSIYSTNEGNYTRWDQKTRNYINGLKTENKALGLPYSARYVGSLVADFHRNLLKGGIFLYPADGKSPNGKLRLLYECIPMAYIMDQAGGKATNGVLDILDIVPSEIHQRSPLIVGSRADVSDYLSA